MATGSHPNLDAAERGTTPSESTRKASAGEISTASYNPRWYDPRWCLHDPKTGTIFFGIFFAIADGFLILLYVKWAKNFGTANLPKVMAVQTDAATAVAAVYGAWFLLDCLLVAMALRKAGLPGCQAWLLATSLRYLHVAVDPTLIVYTCYHTPDCGTRVLPSVLSLLVTVPLPLAQMVVSKYVRQMREAMLLKLQVKRLEGVLPWMTTEGGGGAGAEPEPATDAVVEAALSRLHPISEDKKLFPERPTAARSAQPRRKGGDLAPLAQQEMMALVQSLQKSIRWPNPSVVARMAAFAASDEATRKKATADEGGAWQSRSAPGRVPGGRRRPRSLTPSRDRKKSSEKKSSAKKSSGRSSSLRSRSARRSGSSRSESRRRHEADKRGPSGGGGEGSGRRRKSGKEPRDRVLGSRERSGGGRDVPKSGTHDESRESRAGREPVAEERERRKSSKYGDGRTSKDSALSPEQVEERERRKSSRYGESRGSKDPGVNLEPSGERERRKSSKYGDSRGFKGPSVSLEFSEERESRKSSKYGESRGSKDTSVSLEPSEERERRKSSKYGESRASKHSILSQQQVEDRERRKSSKYGEVRVSKDLRMSQDQLEDRERRKSSKYGDSRGSKDPRVSQEQMEDKERRKSSSVEERRESRELQHPRRSRELRESREHVAEQKRSRHSTPNVR